MFLKKKIVSLKKLLLKFYDVRSEKGEFQLMLILGLLGMYFDAVVVFFTNSSLFFRLAVAILWHNMHWILYFKNIYSKLFWFGIYSFVEKVKATGKIPPIIRGLISFKWEDEITPYNIKLLKKTLRNLARNLADSRIPANQRIYDELGTMNIQTPSTFCTKVIHNPVRYYRKKG